MQKIAASLVKAQKAFGPALKTKTNPHLKSKYADLSNVIEAVIDALHENGIMLTQHTHETESGVCVETVFIHESGEVYSTGKLHLPAQKNDPQGYGSALTYARRYALMAACGIAPEDDDGESAKKAIEEKAKLTQEDIARIDFVLDGCTTLDELKKEFLSAHKQAAEANDAEAIKHFTKTKDTVKARLEKAQ